MDERIKAAQTRASCNRHAASFDISQKLTIEDVLTVWEFTNWRCIYCNASGRARCVIFTIDHVLALACGGENSIWNIVPACRHCNSSKNDKPVHKWLRDYGRSPIAFEKRFRALHKWLIEVRKHPIKSPIGYEWQYRAKS